MSICPSYDEILIAWEEGYETYLDGESTLVWNPHSDITLHSAWSQGWKAAAEEYPER